MTFCMIQGSLNRNLDANRLIERGNPQQGHQPVASNNNSGPSGAISPGFARCSSKKQNTKSKSSAKDMAIRCWFMSGQDSERPKQPNQRTLSFPFNIFRPSS